VEARRRCLGGHDVRRARHGPATTFARRGVARERWKRARSSLGMSAGSCGTRYGDGAV